MTRKKIGLAVVVIMFAVMLISAFPSTNTSLAMQSENYTITINANGRINAKPDTATIGFAVQTMDKNMETSIGQNAGITNSLIELLQTLNINKEDITTNNYSVYSQYDYSRGQEFLGHVVYNAVNFKTKNIENIGQIIDEISVAGATNINNVSFSVEDTTELYNKALLIAVENAKVKAQALSGGKNVVIKEIKEQSYNQTMPIYENVTTFKNLNRLDSSSTPIMQGEYIIVAQVLIEFTTQ